MLLEKEQNLNQMMTWFMGGVRFRHCFKAESSLTIYFLIKLENG